jgi:hypothetical protein
MGYGKGTGHVDMERVSGMARVWVMADARVWVMWTGHVDMARVRVMWTWRGRRTGRVTCTCRVDMDPIPR